MIKITKFEEVNGLRENGEGRNFFKKDLRSLNVFGSLDSNLKKLIYSIRYMRGSLENASLQSVYDELVMLPVFINKIKAENFIKLKRKFCEDLFETIENINQVFREISIKFESSSQDIKSLDMPKEIARIAEVCNLVKQKIEDFNELGNNPENFMEEK